MGDRDGDRRWISYSGGDDSRLTHGERRMVEDARRRRTEARGELCCIVEVRVFERDTHAQVTSPRHATYGPDTDPVDVAAAVARARDALAAWR